MRINFNEEIREKIKEVLNKGFEPLPRGLYEIVVDDVSEMDDGRGFVISFRVISEGFSGRKIFKRVYLKSREGDEAKELTMLGMFSGFLDSCGVTEEQRDELFSNELTAERIFSLLTGKVLTALIAHRMYNGNAYEEIKKIVEFKDDSNVF